MTELDSADHENIGQRIKSYRKRQGLTLVQLSERSGVSRAALSKIERGEISPTYLTLRKVALGLDQTIAGLVAEDRTAQSIDIELVRADESGLSGQLENGYKFLAGSAIAKSVQCFTSEISSDFKSASELLHTHSTDDIVFVLRGSIACHFEGRKPIQLQPGDSLFYRGTVPHAFSLPFDQELGPEDAIPRALWVSLPLDG